MTSRRALFVASALALPVLAAASPVGTPQALPPHRPPHAAPLSQLPAPKPLTGTPAPYGGTPIDVLTYHNDNGRTGWNQAETDLTPASVMSSKFGLLQTLIVDGNVFAQPLLVSNFTMPDKSVHDVLIVVTGHDTVYAFDARTYAVLWQKSMGTAQSSNDVGCGDVQPEYGISSTPVILRRAANSALIYLVAATEPSPYQFHTQLHVLQLATGRDVLTPVEISPSATLRDGSTLNFDSQNEWSRASLAAANGSIYVSIGSHCDANEGSISGWLLRYSSALGLQTAFHTIETPHGGTELASIWMTGFAPAIDPSGNVYVVTGNGDYTGGGALDWGESVLSLNPRASGVRSRFTPAGYADLNAGDVDFGSGGVMLIPNQTGQTTPLAVAMGKSAVLYLLDANNLGGLTAKDTGALQATSLGQNGLWGGPAYYNSPSAGPLVYEQIDGDVLRSWSVASTPKPALTQVATGSSSAGYGGSLPIVSSNGSAASTGLVWLVRRSAPPALEAYDASALGAPLFSANGVAWSNPDQGNPFLTPMVANGRAYLPGYRAVQVFGLVQ